MKKILVIAVFILLIYQEGFCTAASKIKSENLYPINNKSGAGYINKTGEIVIEQKFQFTGRFEGAYAIAQAKNSKYGIIDKNGNTVIAFEYDELDKLSENFVMYKKDNKWGFIDIIKNQKSEPKFDNVQKFKEGYAAVEINNKWGFINTKGELKIEPKYYKVSNFSEGLAAVSFDKYGTAGYIDKNGKLKISFKENNLEPREFHEGLAPLIFGEDKACSYINKKGKIVIDSKKIYPMNAYCGSFYEGYTVFYIDNDPQNIITGFMDKKGRIRYSMRFSIPKNVSEGEFSAFDDFSSGMARFTLDYRTGYFDSNFRLLIPPIYEFGQNFIYDLAYVKFEDKEGYIDKFGRWIWSKEREGM